MKLGEKLGEGSARNVYKYSNRKVIKMAKNLAGRRQNQTEATMQPSKILPVVYKHAPDFEWIVTDLLQPVTKEHLEKSIGVDMEVYYKYACQILQDRFAHNPKLV